MKREWIEEREQFDGYSISRFKEAGMKKLTIAQYDMILKTVREMNGYKEGEGDLWLAPALADSPPIIMDEKNRNARIRNRRKLAGS